MGVDKALQLPVYLLIEHDRTRRMPMTRLTASRQPMMHIKNTLRQKLPSYCSRPFSGIEAKLVENQTTLVNVFALTVPAEREENVQIISHE